MHLSNIASLFEELIKFLLVPKAYIVFQMAKNFALSFSRWWIALNKVSCIIYLSRLHNEGLIHHTAKSIQIFFLLIRSNILNKILST